MVAGWCIKSIKNILDNEASDEFLAAIIQNGVKKYEKVTPHIHNWNVAKKGIGIFKDYFKAILVGVDKTLPIHFWD